MEEKKSSKGLKILVVFLVLIILGLAGYICYDKGVFDSLLGKQEDNNLVENSKLSEEEVNKLHDSLLTQSKNFGFYFERKASIDEIPSNVMVQYALNNYLSENNIKYGDDYDNIGVCGESSYDYYFCDLEEKYEKGDNAKELKNEKTAKMTVKKDVVDSYIKEHFNTDRKFNADDAIGDVVANGYLQVLYNSEKSEYYLVRPHRGGESINIASKLISYEQKGDELTILDKAVVCAAGESGIICQSSYPLPSLDNKISYFIYENGDGVLDSNRKEIKDGKKYFESGDVPYNFDAMFEDFDSILNTYKHTFKKASDGKYYWYSSEIVNE